METRANYVIAGSFVVGLMMAALIFVLWLSQDLTFLPSKERLRKRLHLNALLFMAHFRQVSFRSFELVVSDSFILNCHTFSSP